MPTKEVIGANKITERMLVPHLRNKLKGGNGSYSSTSPSNSNFNIIVLGEEIQLISAIAISNDGKAFIADIVSANNKSAIAFNTGTGIADSIVTYQKSGKLKINGANFEIGKTIFLVAGSPNYSTTLPDEAPGNIIQRLGITVSENEIELGIESEYRIE